MLNRWRLGYFWFFLRSRGFVIWVRRRARVSESHSSTKQGGEKPVFETTMGDLRDVRQALRPLQKDCQGHPTD